MNETVKPSAAPAVKTAKVDVTRHGAVAALTLNRPEALNAFDDEMRQVFSTEIPKIARNPDVYVVVLKSSSPKAFSAGGDVRALVKAAAADQAVAASYFAGEYQLNWLLDCFSKPTVSLINGLCMGSGAGLTCFNTHRVAGENYKFAMPETAIGLFPDVGVAHPLARLPWPMGLYLGLSGRSIGRADAHWLGLVTHCVAGAQHGFILDQLADSQPIDPLLDGLHEALPAGPLQAERAMIEDLFSGGSIVEIMQRLRTASGASAAFAEATYADLAKRSPLSLVLTDRHIRSVRSLDLRETLIQDYRLALRCLKGRDFAEGVRAALVDKDGAPKWQHARVEDITANEVASYFASLGAEELNLLTRTEMQNARF
ncbi:MAG: enoyl-CoA hydratase/isomerase family protein [Hyphomicrobium sp.]